MYMCAYLMIPMSPSQCLPHLPFSLAVTPDWINHMSAHTCALTHKNPPAFNESRPLQRESIRLGLGKTNCHKTRICPLIQTKPLSGSGLDVCVCLGHLDQQRTTCGDLNLDKIKAGSAFNISTQVRDSLQRTV